MVCTTSLPMPLYFVNSTFLTIVHIVSNNDFISRPLGSLDRQVKYHLCHYIFLYACEIFYCILSFLVTSVFIFATECHLSFASIYFDPFITFGTSFSLVFAIVVILFEHSSFLGSPSLIYN